MQWLQNCWTRFEMVFNDGSAVTFKGLPGIGWENITYFDEQGNKISYKELKRKYAWCEFISLLDEDGHRDFVYGDMSKWSEYVKSKEGYDDNRT